VKKHLNKELKGKDIMNIDYKKIKRCYNK